VPLQQLGRTDASVFNHTTNLKLTLPVGKYSTVFQVEIYAILACFFTIIMSVKNRSSLVAETKSALSELSTFNSVPVHLLWVPGHNNVPGNEIAEELAKQAAALESVGPEPVFGISSDTAQNTISSWASSEHRNLWQSTAGCRQAEMFL